MTFHAVFDSLSRLTGVPTCAPDAPLGPAETRLLDALFVADGATAASLGRRVAAQRPALETALGVLVRRGLVEQVASRAWLTGAGFALRRAGQRGA